MADDKALLQEARVGAAVLLRTVGNTDSANAAYDAVTDALDAFEMLENQLAAKDAEIAKLRQDVSTAAHMTAGLDFETCRERLAAKDKRIELLTEALQSAEPFTLPEITRGPSSDAWMDMRRLVEKALSAPPNSGKLGQRPMERGDFGPTVVPPELRRELQPPLGLFPGLMLEGEAAKCEHDWEPNTDLSGWRCDKCGVAKPPQTEAAPTAWAYEQVCKALEKTKAQLAAAQEQNKAEAASNARAQEARAALAEQLAAANARIQELETGIKTSKEFGREFVDRAEKAERLLQAAMTRQGSAAVVSIMEERDAAIKAKEEAEAQEEQARKCWGEAESLLAAERKRADEAELTLSGCEDTLQRVCRERDALKAFKTYVHERLDKAGVPIDPPSVHRDSGCRIGGRLDVLFGERDALKADQADLAEAVGLVDRYLCNDVAHGQTDNDLARCAGAFLARVSGGGK